MTASEKGHRDLLAAIGKAIRLRRVELDMKRSELAERAGLSYAYVSEIENGTKQASSKALWGLARALGLEPHELMAAAAGAKAPERAPTEASPLRPMRFAGDWSSVVPLAVADEAQRVSWFHLPPSASRASSGSPTAARMTAAAPVAASPGDPAEAGGPGEAGAPAPPVDLPALPDILAGLEMALEGIPDERAELALMLALDERRTRRIVREELDRRARPDEGPSG